MSQDQSSNKRIAKNTLMLYIRMLISMLVGLYTSRVVLQTLGVEDYGIYGVVGGVVSMMGFLNASMSGATSRFITFELGKGDMQRVRDTFSSAMIIHVGIALVVIFLSETVGLWFLCNKLVIPEGRMEAAHWVYQCSIISAAVGITQSPYTAVIMSHEKMDIYAYMELLNVTLKLLIVYLLVIGNFDKLILYSVLSLGVASFMAIIYRFYCIRKFEESHFRWVCNWNLLKPMFVFTGWNIYGKMCNTVRTQGNNFLINMFFGVLLNAATNVASILQGVVEALSTNVISAMGPQIVKSYANNDNARFNFLLNYALKISSVLLSIFVVPMIVCCKEILTLWLVTPPEHSILFSQLVMVSSIFSVMYNSVYWGIFATGKMQNVSTLTGTILLLSVPLLYFLYLFGFEPEWSFILAILCSVLSLVLGVVFLKKQCTDFDSSLFINSIIKTILTILVVYVVVYYTTKAMDTGFYKLTTSFFFSVFLLLIEAYYLLLNPEQRYLLKTSVSNLLKR